MKPLAAGCVLVAAGLLAARTAQAQFVPLSRCHSAYPCAIPFEVQYRPDPQIAAQYGGVSNTALVAKVALRTPVVPQIEVRTSPDAKAIDDAVRRFLATHPPPKTAAAKATPNPISPGG